MRRLAIRARDRRDSCPDSIRPTPQVRNNCRVHGAFAIVLWVVCIVGILAALVALVASRKTWEEFRESALVMDSEAPRAPPAGSVAADLERDAEIREMLEARNARRARRGEPPLDVEAEVQRELARLSDLQ